MRERGHWLSQLSESCQSPKEFTCTRSTASAYPAGSGGSELLPADDDGPDTPETANTQGGPGRLYQLNREGRTGALVA